MSMLRRGGRPSTTAVVIAVMVLGAWAWAAEGEGPPKGTAGAPAPQETDDPQRTAGPQDVKVENLETPEVKKAADVELPKEAELRERVQARWDAVIKGELDKAYGFETPEYRKAYTEQDYKEEIGRRVRWHVAKLKDLRYDRADEVEAIITLDYSFALPTGDQLVRTTGNVTERWSYSEGQWWRQQARPTLGGKTQSQPSLPQ